MRGVCFAALVLLIPIGGQAQDDHAVSVKGRYLVSLTPIQRPVPIREWNDWSIHIERRDQTPLQLRDVVLEGGMPTHGHGLPSAPRVTPGPGGGDFLARGLRFNMAGRWELRVIIADGDGADAAVFPLVLAAPSAPPARGGSTRWSDAQRASLRSLSIGALPPAPADLSNRVAEDPRAVTFGHELFFDPGLSGNGKLACASCHRPEQYFTDGRRRGRGTRDLDRNTPSLVGLAYARWFDWDGRRDSAWSQALSPIEAPAEMHGSRVEALRFIGSDASYRRQYEALFGPLPALDGLPRRASPSAGDDAQRKWDRIAPAHQEAITRAFVNVGKVLAAYERRLLPGVAPFDRYVQAVLAGDDTVAQDTLSPKAIAGLKLFLSSDAQCLNCHNGPLFTNGGFHNIGTGNLDEARPDFGRSIGVQALLATDFSCLGPYNDDPGRDCPELEFLNRHDENGSQVGAYKVPGLRNAAMTGPYMHDGRFATLGQVIDHYRNPANARAALEFRPMFDMTSRHREALIAFIESLTAPVDAPQYLLHAPSRRAHAPALAEHHAAR